MNKLKVEYKKETSNPMNCENKETQGIVLDGCNTRNSCAIGSIPELCKSAEV